MKGILRVFALFLICFVLVTNGDKKGKGKANDEDESEAQTVEAEGDRDRGSSKRFPERGGRCSCRDLENQVDQLEFRLDRMIDLWNDFVDKNRNPYDQRQTPYPGARVPPQQGGRGPYSPPDGRLPPRRPGYGGRSVMEDEPANGPRRFRF